MIEISDFNFRYGKKKVLNNINLTFNKGETVVLAGANGAGKTTLLRSVCGILFAPKGRVQVNKFPVGAKTRKKIAYIPSSLSYYKDIRIMDAIKFHSSFYKGFSYSDIGGFKFDLKQKVGTLSRGEKTLFYLSLALSTNPEYLLIDDVIHFLDPHLRDIFIQSILQLIDSNQLSLIIATQDPINIEGLVDRVVVLNNGNIVMDESVENLKRDFVRIFAEDIPKGLPVIFTKEWEDMKEFYIYPFKKQTAGELPVEYLNLSEILRAFIGGKYDNH